MKNKSINKRFLNLVCNSLYPYVEGHPKYYFFQYSHVPTIVPLYLISYCSNLDILENMTHKFEGRWSKIRL